MVGPQLKLPTFESGAEVFDAHEGGQEFPVEGGVVSFCFCQFVTEKTEGLPVASYLLLEDAADVGVRGIGGQGEHRSWQWVGQRDGGDQGRLGCGERCGQGRRKFECFWVTC